MNPQRILCPVDFSSCSEHALKKAVQLADETNARLYIVHVDQGGQSIPPGSSGYVAELDEHKRLLEEATPDNPRIHFELHYLKGIPADEIRRFVLLRDIDLIVMGTHGRTGLARVLLGSIAEQISRNAPCQVLLASPNDKTVGVQPS